MQGQKEWYRRFVRESEHSPTDRGNKSSEKTQPSSQDRVQCKYSKLSIGTTLECVLVVSRVQTKSGLPTGTLFSNLPIICPRYRLLKYGMDWTRTRINFVKNQIFGQILSIHLCWPHRAHPPRWPPRGNSFAISTNQRPRNLLHRDSQTQIGTKRIIYRGSPC